MGEDRQTISLTGQKVATPTAIKQILISILTVQFSERRVPTYFTRFHKHTGAKIHALSVLFDIKEMLFSFSSSCSVFQIMIIAHLLSVLVTGELQIRDQFDRFSTGNHVRKRNVQWDFGTGGEAVLEHCSIG